MMDDFSEENPSTSIEFLATMTPAVVLSAYAIQSEQRHRPMYFAGFALLSWKSFHRLQFMYDSWANPYLIGCLLPILAAHIINVLFIDKIDLHRSTGSSAMTTALRIVQNPRRLPVQTTSWWIRKIIPRDICRFVAMKVLLICILFAARRILKSFSPARYVVWGDISAEKEHLMRRWPEVTGRELRIRAELMISGVPVQQLELAMWHNLLAIFFVATTLESPDEWRTPLYGSPLTAHSMRRFWSQFEHRLVYYSYQALTRRLLDLVGMQRSVQRRMLQNALVFVLAGVLHGLVASQTGSCAPWVDAKYYWINFGAIAAEECFFWFSGPGLIARIDDRWQKGFGYLWVISFHFWLAPKMVFPNWRCGL